MGVLVRDATVFGREAIGAHLPIDDLTRHEAVKDIGRQGHPLGGSKFTFQVEIVQAIEIDVSVATLLHEAADVCRTSHGALGIDCRDHNYVWTESLPVVAIEHLMLKSSGLNLENV